MTAAEGHGCGRHEYPGQAFLTDAQVRRLLAYKDRKEWAAFLDVNEDFPDRVEVGKSRNGKPRLLFIKELVYASDCPQKTTQEGGQNREKNRWGYAGVGGGRRGFG